MYGVAWGTLLTLAGLQLGAVVAFALGRSLLRDFAKQRIADSANLTGLSNAIGGASGARLVALCRAATVFPFALLNYVFAVTSIDFLTYSLATLIGLTPGVLLYSIAGELTVKEEVMR